MTSRLIAGKYALVRQIGSGGMGQVWEAFDRNLRRKVAVKLLSPAYLDARRALIEHEARAIARLKSPHVVQIFDAGVEGDTPYLVMELLTGEDLESRLQRVERLTVAALALLVEQAASALTAAHAADIVHRDIKPANVFLARSDTPDDTVKVLDFGIVTMLASGDDATEEQQAATGGDAAGTPAYMSPEQICASPVDHRSDLWSLGVLVYRALTGTQPFNGPSLGALLTSICTDPFSPPSTILAGIPPAMDVFFDKALAKDPARRFQSAAAFAEAFAALARSREERRAKILVVDDEPDVAKLVRQHFRTHIQRSVYEFVFAYDGEGALEELRKHPDIEMVLTDLTMPGMSGLTLMARIGVMTPLVRTVVVSAYSDMDNIRAAMNRGAFDFLVKPIDFDDLEVTIGKTLRLTAELRESARSLEENSLLRMFVSPSLVERMRPGALGRGAEVGLGAVVFLGVTGHDALSSAEGPDAYVRALNANFEVIVPALARRGGVVHKFFGAAVMAVFQGEDHLARALDACLEVRAQLSRLAQKTGSRSPFALGVSIGVAAGEMISGEIGSRAFERLDFAVLGELRRAAVLLQGAAGKNQVLVSAAAFEAAGGAFDGVPVQEGALPEGLAAFELVCRATDSRGLMPGDPGVTRDDRFEEKTRTLR